MVLAAWEYCSSQKPGTSSPAVSLVRALAVCVPSDQPGLFSQFQSMGNRNAVVCIQLCERFPLPPSVWGRWSWGGAHSTVAPPHRLFRDHLALRFTLCLQHPIAPSCPAASCQVHHVPRGFHRAGPPSAGTGRSPALDTLGMTFSGSILQWEHPLTWSNQGPQHPREVGVLLRERHAIEAVIPGQVGTAGQVAPDPKCRPLGTCWGAAPVPQGSSHPGISISVEMLVGAAGIESVSMSSTRLSPKSATLVGRVTGEGCDDDVLPLLGGGSSGDGTGWAPGGVDS